MKTLKASALVLVSLCVGAALWFAYSKVTDADLVTTIGSEVHSGIADEIVVLRTPGGLLEVATVPATEHFDQKVAYTFLGMKVGETVPHIRVPAVYRYHIELEPEWVVHRSDEVFSVVVPALQPSLPVAVDLGRMEKDVGGTWVLAVLDGDDDLDALEREITATLAKKASSPFYVNLQREAARQTVSEFTKKWLVTQTRWKDASKLTIKVRFADEPEGRV